MVNLVDSDVIVFAFSDNSKKEACRKIIQTEDVLVNTLILIESFSKILTITKNRDLAEGMVKEFLRMRIL